MEIEVLIQQIKIGERLRKQNKNITELAENIKQVGLINPISIDSENNLLCGLRRFEACKLLGWGKIPCRIFPLDIEADENLFRQEFTPEEKVRGLERIEERERKKAREIQVSKLKRGDELPDVEILPQRGKTHEYIPRVCKSENCKYSYKAVPRKLWVAGDGVWECPECGYGIAPFEDADFASKRELTKTRDIVAKKVGWSGRTYEKAKMVVESEEKELIDMMNRTGNVNKSYRYIKQAEDEKRVLEQKPFLEIKGKFKTILVDPPWQYDTNLLGRTIPLYATQQIDEIENIAKYADDNCHLYLWATNAFIPKACLLLKAWGFEYKTIITWIKPSIGIGSYFRNSTEHMLFAIKGSLPTRLRDIPTHFNANRTNNSEKPDESYSIIEKASYPPYLELYATKDRIGDWVCKGIKNANPDPDKGI